MSLVFNAVASVVVDDELKEKTRKNEEDGEGREKKSIVGVYEGSFVFFRDSEPRELVNARARRNIMRHQTR